MCSDLCTVWAVLGPIDQIGHLVGLLEWCRNACFTKFSCLSFCPWLHVGSRLPRRSAASAHACQMKWSKLRGTGPYPDIGPGDDIVKWKQNEVDALRGTRQLLGRLHPLGKLGMWMGARQ